MGEGQLWGRMDEEIVEYIHIQILLSGKKKYELKNFACKWSEIENTILSEVTQPEKMNM